MSNISQELESTGVIILAAGRGTRMQSKRKNKVTFQLGGRPMIVRTVDNLEASGIGQKIVVVGYQMNSVKKVLGDRVDYAVQTQQLGTGDALKVALPHLNKNIKTVLLVSGDDSAFYPPTLYRELVVQQRASNAAILFVTINKEDPTGLGRIVRDKVGNVQKIVEEKVASLAEKQITEINTGFYCFTRFFLEAHIGSIRKNSVSGEYYATDLVEIALRRGLKVATLQIQDNSVWQGFNTRRDLTLARQRLTD